MKFWLIAAVLLVVVVQFPAALATLALAAASSPAVWAFAAGLLARPYIARRWAQ